MKKFLFFVFASLLYVASVQAEPPKADFCNRVQGVTIEALTAPEDVAIVYVCTDMQSENVPAVDFVQFVFVRACADMSTPRFEFKTPVYRLRKSCLKSYSNSVAKGMRFNTWQPPCKYDRA